MKNETLAAQGLGWVDEATRAISPPLHASSTYLRDVDNGYRSGRAYIRADNPAFDQPEALLNALEGGAGAALFASGMAAAVTAFLSLGSGDHVIAPKTMYWGLRGWLAEWSADVDLVDMSDPGAVRRALRPNTRLVWAETPANPTWDIADLAALAEIAHRAGARLAVDSTCATPVLTQPIALGADLVMHSATKYLNGHSDLIAGALVTARDDDYWQRILGNRAHMGAVLGSFEAWLLLRGMRTLFPRVRIACANAMALAERLSANPNVAQVLYPGLKGFKGHDIAVRQMKGGFGGMLSIRVKGGEQAAIGAAARVKIWKRATSLGGVESLIEHRASVEGPDTPCPPDLLRLSAGIEDVDDLVADLEQALG
ncbi:MAG: PLP-dependent transferase [Alphaproteobacteria bacterium]|nr:PLP-dependent transferase [Alphaproteobacteria bacterium]